MNTFSTLDNYRIVKILGTGYSGKVKLGQDLATGQTFALKILSANQPADQLLAALKHEFSILKNLTHPSIVKMYDLKSGVYTSRKKGTQKTVTFAVIELATGGELFDVIFHSKGFDENLSRFYFRLLVDSMRYLHDQKIAHRDLKPENLLLDSLYNLKVVDFGFATIMQPNKLNKTRLGTEKYMAPELLYHKAYEGRKVDVFAAGVILFVLYSGHPPFNQATEQDPYYRTFVKANEKFWEFHAKQNQKRHYSPEFKELINTMLSFNPMNRVTFEDIAEKSAWFKQPVNDQVALGKVAQYMHEMRVAKQQAIPSNGSGNNRGEVDGETLEELQKMVLPDIKFEDLTDIKVDVPSNNSSVIQSEDRNLLVAMVRKTAEEVGCTKAGNKTDRLVLGYGNEQQGQTVLEVKFYKLSGNQFEVQFVRKEGDYFAFQKAKALIQDALTTKMEPIKA
jgi:serine/threonine protein kinase